MILLALPFALAIAPAPSGDESGAGQTVVVAPLAADESVNEGARARLQQALMDGLERSGLTVSQELAPIPADGCAEQACWQEAAASSDAAFLVTATVATEGRDYSFRLEGREGESGEVLASMEDRCEICGLDEVADLIASSSAVLGKQLTSRSGDAPVLFVSTTPAGAIVTVDGEELGETPFEGALPPGAHLVRVSKPGHVSIERELELTPGTRSRADFTLERVGTDVAARRSLRPLGWGALAGGLAALGAGVALLAIDDRENQRRCGAANKDPDGDCKYVFHTMWGGAGLTALGTAAAATGIAILVFTRNKRGKTGSPRRASLTPILGPGALGLQGRF